MRGAARRALRRVLPASLAGRTALFLFLALMTVQAAGLTIHALDRMDLQREARERDVAARVFLVWRTMLSVPSERRETVLAELDLPPWLEASLDDRPRAGSDLRPPPERVARALSPEAVRAVPIRLRPREVRAGQRGPSLYVSLRLPDGPWVNYRVAAGALRPWHSDTFLVAFVLMTVAAAGLILWATRRLTRPVRDLASAADALGRDVNATPMPEGGPREVATAARAFNTMAERIRRFVSDRTQMLAAIGHDLRTPITRMRLRAELMEDDELRARMLADLAEMEAMVSATLAFARDEAAAEPSVPLDLAALGRTVLDEASDARPGTDPEAFSYQGPERLTVRGRPIALKRALANLVANAADYGGAARLRLEPPRGGQIRLCVEDEGPGVPEESREAVFQPFHRLETSRNRETGGVGLGLPIARNILRAHGGDVVLENRSGGGLAALVTLPA